MDPKWLSKLPDSIATALVKAYESLDEMKRTSDSLTEQAALADIQVYLLNVSLLTTQTFELVLTILSVPKLKQLARRFRSFYRQLDDLGHHFGWIQIGSSFRQGELERYLSEQIENLESPD
ncbi:hypothetical protein [Vibrio hyugaensis]|uniref:hypothetical protein n=1 Tax=Vibrio hyugaensis TaxID=1534743 RepID=UPI000CE474BE|nr:hypothetical protein [Vibrio hyugaensis]